MPLITRNKKIFNVKINSKTGEIQDPAFDETLSKLYEERNNYEFELNLINESNISDNRLNAVINYYVSDCLKPKGKRSFANPFCIDSKTGFTYCVKQFIANAINDQIDGDLEGFECFLLHHPGDYFRFNIPANLLSKSKKLEFMYLGADYLAGSFLTTQELFKYVLPKFYFFLFDIDAMNDEERINLANYQFGLK